MHYIRSRVWADAQGRNRLGTLIIPDQQFFAAREAAKADARPGGYVATGGHGGILGQISHVGRVSLTYLPAYKHTHLSDVRVTILPRAVEAVTKGPSGLERIEIAIKGVDGSLLEDAIPAVSILKDGGYCTLEWGDDSDFEADLIAAIDHKLTLGKLAGFVVEVHRARRQYDVTHTPEARHKSCLFGLAGRAGRSRQPRRFRRSASGLYRRRESHVDQGALSIDGESDETRQPAARG